ncbi:uncharacterized protein MONOS_16394 [Monocercomonoides exilis]|uniref:uncharacterized protein n=1 Tax=Monocercomonoides exilis TaxID=2049356 RepID=UPI00355AB5CA|nr:hypothetical protein MONOS_16394 [Monocercomonoides exilis]|eukprot:MONOS_16394.1-p1 / transcript=MONOS_16394.1 / gene=MONOS_16394 / organism=Monocercomonoides_exilis_PA203 / gene_product=unspecified product / transcript_product=unspecified product / location=Mono_scaffold01701:3726-3938(+) / protein_length=71 / sequence_SO=supercontig / SO=protein_coding / is_pseudo=false
MKESCEEKVEWLVVQVKELDEQVLVLSQTSAEAGVKRRVDAVQLEMRKKERWLALFKKVRLAAELVGLQL